jgi:MoxR-like ATPase
MIYSQLDPDKIPELVGSASRERMSQCLRLLRETAWPLYFTGPSGSGKTLMAMNLAKQYSLEVKVPPYYVQLSPEMTKTSLILGLRLIDGSLTVVDGVVAECMRTGGILVVDEAAHTTHELLLMFNSILDRTSVTSVGDRIIYSADTFRIIFCGNDSSYAGNVRLPQSFAQRMVAFFFDYPDFESELAIACRIAEDECSRPFTVPPAVARYVLATIRLIRSGQYPLSARNAAIILVLLNLAQKGETGEIKPYFTDPLSAEAKRRAAAGRILQIPDGELSMEALEDERITEFQRFVSGIGVETFRQIFLSGSMYYLDVDGLELDQETVRGEIETRII